MLAQGVLEPSAIPQIIREFFPWEKLDLESEAVIFIVNFNKRVAQKLHRIIPLHFWTSNFSISFWEDPTSPHFHDFRT